MSRRIRVSQTPQISSRDTEDEDFSDDEIKDKYRRSDFQDPHALSWQWAILTIAIGCVMYYMVHRIDYSFPKVITEDEAIEDPSLFSGERARNILQKLTAIGPRILGSPENEIHTPGLIEDEIRKIIGTSHPSQKIIFQRQKGSGAFPIRQAIQYTSVYRNIQNVVVQLEGSEGLYSILLNCHYDTNCATSGATDDAISCSIMLELLKVLSQSTIRLKHNIVFLFNGAEEVGLQGSHLFMRHAWRKKARVFINLEGAGAGGRAILFQTGPKSPWVFEYFAKNAPHPHALVMAEEMFQNGVIPSDSDFRIFRDFGRIPGMDFAFARYGQLYHTKFDTHEYIPSGSYQQQGENVLAILRQLGNAPEIYDIQAHFEGQTVYYDFLGYYLIYYDAEFGVKLNYATLLLAGLSILVFVKRLAEIIKSNKTSRDLVNFEINDNENEQDLLKINIGGHDVKQDKIPIDMFIDKNKLQLAALKQLISTVAPLLKGKLPEEAKPGTALYEAFKELFIAIIARVIGIIATVSVAMTTAKFINAKATLLMPWYSNVWLIFPIYWCPCMVAYTFIPNLINIWRSKENRFSTSTSTQISLVAAQIPIIGILFVANYMGFRSAGMFVLPVLTFAIANLVMYSTSLYKTVHRWAAFYMIVNIPSFLMNLYISLLMYSIFIPSFGRSGVKDAETNIALITAALCILTCSFVVPFMRLVKKSNLVFASLTVLSTLLLLAALNTHIGHPYRGGPVNPAPQRFWIMHTSREFRNETGHLRRSESGFFIVNQDSNSPRTIPVKRKSNLRALKEDCDNELYCGLPFHLTRSFRLAPMSSWVPGPEPFLPNCTEIIMEGNRNCQSIQSTCSFILKVKGPDRMTIILSPRQGASLVSWNIPTEPKVSDERNNRTMFYIHMTGGQIDEDFEFFLTFKVTPEQLSGKPVFDIGLGGNHVHHDKYRMPIFQNLLDSLPEYSVHWGWISAYRGYTF